MGRRAEHEMRQGGCGYCSRLPTLASVAPAIATKWPLQLLIDSAWWRRGHAGNAQVAVLRDGSFIVADGYCNSRVVWFDKTGKYIGECRGRRACKHAMAGPRHLRHQQHCRCAWRQGVCAPAFLDAICVCARVRACV